MKIEGKKKKPKRVSKKTPGDDFSPLLWSKWLYDIRTQLGVKTTKAAAYEDCLGATQPF